MVEFEATPSEPRTTNPCRHPLTDFPPRAPSALSCQSSVANLKRAQIGRSSAIGIYALATFPPFFAPLTHPPGWSTFDCRPALATGHTLGDLQNVCTRLSRTLPS